jgi:conjugative transfer signal peptidase TraF
MNKGLAVATALAELAALAPARPIPRLVWNATASAPIGLYWVRPGEPIARGDLVLATLPDEARRLAAERRYLPSNVPAVKRVAARVGDRICGAGDRILVNGVVAAERLKADGQGRPLPAWQGCRVLYRDEVFLLMEGVPASFDGRYFGPVGTDHVIGRLVPLWTR